jgi:hypothetical protein
MMAMANHLDPDKPALGADGKLCDVDEMIALGVEFPFSPSSPKNSVPTQVNSNPSEDSEDVEEDHAHLMGEGHGQCLGVARACEDPSIALLEEKAKK